MAMKPIVDGEPPYLGVYTTTEIALANAEIAAGSMNYVTGSSLTREEDGAVLFLVGVGKLGSFAELPSLASLAGSGGAAKIGFLQDFTGAVPNTAQAKLAENASSRDVAAPTDGVTDAAPKLQLALAGAQGVLNLLDGNYAINSKISMTAYKSLSGRGRNSRLIVPPVPGSLILIDWNYNGTTWPASFPGINSGEISNIFIDAIAAGAAGYKVTGVRFAGSMQFRNIKARGLQTLCEQVSGLYCDMVLIERIEVDEQPTADDAFLKLPPSGDALLISQAHAVPHVDSGTPANNRRVNMAAIGPGRNGVTLQAIIGGDYLIDDCTGVAANNFHMEHGQLTWRRSSGSLRDAIFYMRADALAALSVTPLVIDGGASPNVNPSVLDGAGLLFVYEQAFSGGGYTTTKPNVAIVNTPSLFVGEVHVKNWFRSVKLAVNDQSYGAHFGINFGIPDFDNYSHFASGESTFKFNDWHIRGKSQDLPATSTGLDPSSGNSVANAIWNGATGTRVYALQYLVDKMRRVGVAGSSTVSLALVNGGNAATLILATDIRMPAVARLYSGPSVGTYDSVVDIPVIDAVRLIDTGLDVAGYPWQSRTAGGMDAINAFSPVAYSLEPGERGAASDAYGKACVYVRGNATVPTAGAWRRDDKYLLSSPVDNGSKLLVGWERRTNCTLAAPSHTSPGDWAEMWVEYIPDIASSTQFLSAASTVNTIYKRTGRVVRDTTTGKLVSAAGPSATSVWSYADGTLAYTPV